MRPVASGERENSRTIAGMCVSLIKFSLVGDDEEVLDVPACFAF